MCVCMYVCTSMREWKVKKIFILYVICWRIAKHIYWTLRYQDS